MAVDIPIYNLGIIVGICAVLIYQLTRFEKSEKPIFIEPQNLNVRREVGHNSLGEPIFSEERQYTDGEFQRVRKKAKKECNTKTTIYYTTYLLPVFLALLSFIAVINLDVGIPLLISAFASTVISEVAIKIWDIGKKEFHAY